MLCSERSINPPPRYQEISVSSSVAARVNPDRPSAPARNLQMPGRAIRDDTDEFDEFDDIPVTFNVRPGFDRGFA